MYLVRYSHGNWDETFRDVFVTEDLEVAKKWAEKYNRLILKWQDYFSVFSAESNKLALHWNHTENKKAIRFYQIMFLNEAEIIKIEKR